MAIPKFKRLAPAVVASAFSVGALLVTQPAAAADKEPREQAAPGHRQELTAETLPALLELIRPHGSEWRHLKVEWLTDVVAARKRAAAEDKPIVICYTGGAGYNEPLGVC